MSQKQELIDKLIPLLKKKGYKKKSNTWYKETADLVILFHIQHSNYSQTEYSIILGVAIKAIKNNKGLSLNGDITHEISSKNEKGEFLSPETLVSVLEFWEQQFGDLTKLRRKAVEGNLPICSSGKAITFLTTVRLA